MAIRTTWRFDSKKARDLGDGAMREMVEWGVPTLEARVKETIQSWPSGPIIDTGAMLNSVRGELTGPTSGQVSVGVDYAVYVEFGTRYMPGRPFFQTAIDRFRGEWAAKARSL